MRFTICIRGRCVDVTVTPGTKLPYVFKTTDELGRTITHRYASFEHMMMLDLDRTNFKRWNSLE
jgi:hypothetical protein